MVCAVSRMMTGDADETAAALLEDLASPTVHAMRHGTPTFTRH